MSIRIGFCLAVVGLVIACEPADIGPRSTEKGQSEKAIDRLTLRIDRDGGLVLEDETIAREDLARAFARLAEQVRHHARDHGIPIDPEGPLPATIVIEADDETPCSKVLSLARDWQESGFGRFSLDSRHPDPAAARPAEPAPAPAWNLVGRPLSAPVAAQPAEDADVAPSGKESGLPAGVRTIPITLLADDRRQIGPVQVGEIQLQGFEALKAELTSILNDPDLPFDQAVIYVDPVLNYAELRRVAELLVSLNLAKISFDRADAGSAR
jgi:biopolymer transport protein ExbD